MISNKLYVLTKEDAKKVGLEDYFGMNKTDLRIKIVTNESVTCEEIINNQTRVISGQKKEIIGIDSVNNDKVSSFSYDKNMKIIK